MVRTRMARQLHPSLAALALAAPLLVGCGARGGVRGPVMHAERAAPAVSEIGDDAFAAAVHDLLLSEPKTAERSVRLGAVESRQMTRASARFHAHATDRGLAAVSGGLYLVRVGEPAQGILGPDGAAALKDAVREFAAKGDEGRAPRALRSAAPGGTAGRPGRRARPHRRARRVDTDGRGDGRARGERGRRR